MAIFVQLLAAQVGVGENVRIPFVTPALALPGRLHPLPDGLRALPRRLGRQLLDLHRRHFHVQVDAVQQRAGDAAHIALDGQRRAGALVARIGGKTAGAGIHGRHQHDVGRVSHRYLGPGDGHLPGLQRLAQHFQHILAKLGQFVQEQHAVVGQAHLTRFGYGPAADQARVFRTEP